MKGVIIFSVIGVFIAGFLVVAEEEIIKSEDTIFVEESSELVDATIENNNEKSSQLIIAHEEKLKTKTISADEIVDLLLSEEQKEQLKSHPKDPLEAIAFVTQKIQRANRDSKK